LNLKEDRDEHNNEIHAI